MNTDIKVNCLDMIVTRIDYDDQIEISNDTYIKIKEACKEHGLTKIETRNLDSKKDFSSNDSVVYRSVPEDYLKTLPCREFSNENFVVEVNQFFVRFMQKSTQDYEKYMKNHYPIVEEIFNILEVPCEQILRISIRKIDEIYYDDLQYMQKIFKPEIIQANIFEDKQRWDVPNSGSFMSQNFAYGKYRVNFSRSIDRGSIRVSCEDDEYTDIILYRLLMDYEAYSREITEEKSIKEMLSEINDITEELFLKSFTQEGSRRLEKGELGDYGVF